MSDPTQHSTPASHWQPILGIEGAFELRRLHGMVPLRAVAVQLRPGSVCVYSPVPKAGEPALTQLGARGTPILLAPNAFHTLGLPEHARAFANTKVVASVRACGRIKRKTGLAVEDLSVLRELLPENVSLLELPPIKSGEVWLSVRSNGKCAWIVCDAFLNLQRPPGGILGLIVKLMHMGPGLSIGSTFKWMIKDRSAYREWLLARIAEDQPTILVPSHGQIIDDPELPRALESLVRRRLGRE